MHTLVWPYVGERQLRRRSVILMVALSCDANVGGLQPDDADFAYIDGPGGNLYLEDADDVRGCTLTFGHLRGIALNPAESVMLINRLIQELE